METELRKNDYYNSIEAKFWQQIGESAGEKKFKFHPTYSMDNDISRFPDEYKCWNLNKLTDNESIIHNANGPKIPGVNSHVSYFIFLARVTGLPLFTKASRLLPSAPESIGNFLLRPFGLTDETDLRFFIRVTIELVLFAPWS